MSITQTCDYSRNGMLPRFGYSCVSFGARGARQCFGVGCGGGYELNYIFRSKNMSNSLEERVGCAYFTATAAKTAKPMVTKVTAVGTDGSRRSILDGVTMTGCGI